MPLPGAGCALGTSVEQAAAVIKAAVASNAEAVRFRGFTLYSSYMRFAEFARFTRKDSQNTGYVREIPITIGQR
ncbi:hypothetical protein Sme01_44600 [Sphaerisporangium melleum]|nr:hypothetical protein Sme01_44600 [Sphaerisporangium melleum]